MPRLCFVIMPFAKTSSCTEEEWTRIFDELIRPAIEGDPELGYECRRSSATRGSIVRGIVEDLEAAHVVLADLTDRNANVFYELGVRHTLTDRTIIIAQKRDHVPFDLQGYANHEYDWHTEEGRDEFTTVIRRLLREIDAQPDRPDNPVSDFLRGPRAPRASATPAVEPLVERIELLEQRLDALGNGPPVPAPSTSSGLGRSLLGPPPAEGWTEFVRRRSQ